MGLLTEIAERELARKRELAGINPELAAVLSDDLRDRRERMEAASDLRKHAANLCQLIATDESSIAADLARIAADLERVASNLDKVPIDPVEPS